MKDDPRLAPLAKRFQTSPPRGMFRVNEDEFLLCYEGMYVTPHFPRPDVHHHFSEFGLHIDRHGGPSRGTGLIEWEEMAESVACHPPYIFLFNSQFIEVRHFDTGRLTQIIMGNDIACIWHGQGSVPRVTTSGPDEQDGSLSQEALVHVLMGVPDPLGPAGSVSDA